MAQRISAVALDVLNDTEDGTGQDEQADGVQHVQDLLPRGGRVNRVVCRGAAQPTLEDDGANEEKTERDDLDEETGDDEVLSHLNSARLEHQARRTTLDDKGENITEHESLGEPADADQGVMLGVDAAHDATEGHVDGGGKEGGSDEDEKTLDDVGHQLARVVASPCSSNVTNEFDYTIC